MTQSEYSEKDLRQAILTLESVEKVIDDLVSWNKNISSVEDYYSTQTGMQLLAANCTLITAIGEGVKRVNRILPDFLSNHFSEIPWNAIIGMRNHIAHGYFELDADLVFDVVMEDIPGLKTAIIRAIRILK
ncbi:MAG: DUF86 domain-containing protein [Muribaculaceae bacterium]|nr:DUF86 domain-containing protein [Muribaculaceae bacterium]